MRIKIAMTRKKTNMKDTSRKKVCIPASAESKMAVAQSEASARVGVGLSIILQR